MNRFIPDEPVVAIIKNNAGKIIRVATNVAPDLKIVAMVESTPNDLATEVNPCEGLPFDVTQNVETDGWVTTQPM